MKICAVELREKREALAAREDHAAQIAEPSSTTPLSSAAANQRRLGHTLARQHGAHARLGQPHAVADSVALQVRFGDIACLHRQRCHSLQSDRQTQIHGGQVSPTFQHLLGVT